MDISAWSVSQVAAWAREAGLSDGVVAALNDNEIDGKILLTLSQEDIRTELAISSLASRRKVLACIEALRMGGETIPEVGTHRSPQKVSDATRQEIRERRLMDDHMLALRLQQEIEMEAEDQTMARCLQQEELEASEHASDPRSSLPFIDCCLVCMEEDVRGFVLACGKHQQCVDCMRDNFKAALSDIDLLPLKCCDIPIDMNCAETILEPKDFSRLLQHTIEKEATNKMHCPKCGIFINLDFIDNSEDKQLMCYGCDTLVCTACHKNAHPKLTCREYKEVMAGEDDLMLELSAKQGWKQCPQCNIMVERVAGCIYMTCKCGAHFCITCGAKWGVCPHVPGSGH